MSNQSTLQHPSYMEIPSGQNMSTNAPFSKLKKNKQQVFNQNALNKGVNLAMRITEEIKLDLEKLKCFEIVENQFAHLGLTCCNGIAIQTSNPAFPPGQGEISLIKRTINYCLELKFEQPISSFNCHVTSSRKTILSGYDSKGQLLIRSEIPQSNLAGSGSQISANAPLGMKASNISRITIDAFDGQLTVTDLSYGF
ncbi:MAG: hypothetical protein WBG70_01595 [Spirulinaceae cyanobacterium]